MNLPGLSLESLTTIVVLAMPGMVIMVSLRGISRISWSSFGLHRPSFLVKAFTPATAGITLVFCDVETPGDRPHIKMLVEFYLSYDSVAGDVVSQIVRCFTQVFKQSSDVNPSS